MKTLICLAVVFSASFAWAQSDQAKPAHFSNDKGLVTVRGCVSILHGDYVLTKQDPGNTYQLQKAGKVKLKSYLGQRVEITGTKSATMDSSDDAFNNAGNASPITITIRSIKTLSKVCQDSMLGRSYSWLS